MHVWTCRIVVTALAAVAAIGAAQAGWENRISRYDAGRLARLDEARAKALSEDQSGRDIELIRALVERHARPVSAASLRGDWQCRTIKVGGMTPDVVYSWHRCRISGRDGKLAFDKESGTQLIRGLLYPREDGGFVVLAGLSVKGEPRHSYSGSGPGAGAATTPDDAVGLLQATGPRSVRIEFPYPAQESTLDIIELRR